MSGAALTVQTKVLAIASTELEATDTLTGLTDIDYCVPFVTKRVTTTSTAQIEHYQVDSWFSSTDTLHVARDENDGAVEAEVTVVEFDSARCNVYSGVFQLTVSAGPDDLTVTVSIGGTVDLSKSFLVFHSLQNSGTQNYYPSHIIRGEISSTTQVTFDRSSDDGTCDGHWYVVESKSTSSDFTVETTDIQLASAATANDNTLGVTSANTVLLGSWKATSTGGNSNADNTVDATLSTDGTTVTVQRASSTGTIDYHAQLVKFTDGTKVQRATITGETGSPMPIDVTLSPAVSATRSTAIIAGNMGSTVTGSFPGTSSADMMDAQCQLTLRDSDAGGDFDELRIQHNTDGGEASNDISWEVVEWGTGGAAPATRRVMVIS